MDHARGAFGNWANKLALARVESYDFQVDPQTKQAITDDAGNPIPTGLLNIVMLESTIPRRKVPFVLSLVGNALYMGGLPEIGSTAVVGWRQQNQPIIIGFIPHGVDQMVRKRQTIPNLAEGEVFIQASGRTVDVEDTQNFFRGARVWLDRYGRVKIDTTDYDLTIGYLLSNEFQNNVTFVNDPVTQNPVFFREKMVGGVERRVDNKGNEVREYGGSSITRASNNIEQTAENQMTLKAFKGLKVQDNSGNRLEVDADGNVKLLAPAGAILMETTGSITRRANGNFQDTVVGNKVEAIGELLSQSIGNVEAEVNNGDWNEYITAGLKQIFAESGIHLDTTGSSPVRLGDAEASNPVALGNELKEALDQLQQILQTAPGIGFGNLGAPVPLNPAIVTALGVWVATYLTSAATNILSAKVFAIRGPTAG